MGKFCKKYWGVIMTGAETFIYTGIPTICILMGFCLYMIFREEGRNMPCGGKKKKPKK